MSFLGSLKFNKHNLKLVQSKMSHKLYSHHSGHYVNKVEFHNDLVSILTKQELVDEENAVNNLMPNLLIQSKSNENNFDNRGVYFDFVSLLHKDSLSKVNDENIHHFLAAGLINKEAEKETSENNVLSNALINTVLKNQQEVLKDDKWLKDKKLSDQLVKQR